ATVPAGLQPGQQAPIDQVVNLPPAPIPGLNAAGAVYVGMVVDPEGAVAELNKLNNFGDGQGVDTSVVTITPHKPSALVGSALGVYPDQAQWGGAVQVNATIQNAAAGDAPATRARVVLTPLGVTPGGPADVTVGKLDVPAVPAWQTVPVTGT